MGVYRTRDGQRWEKLDGMTGFGDVLALAGDGSRLWAGTYGGEIFVRENDVWTLQHDFGTGEQGAVYALAWHDGRLLAGAGQGLYQSSDNGTSFVEIWHGAILSALQFTPFEELEIIFGTLGKGLGHCRADGNDCRLLDAYTGGKLVKGLAYFNERLLIAAEGDGLYLMENDRSFKLLSFPHAPVYPIALYADSRYEITALEGEGLFIRTVGKDTWETIPFSESIKAFAQFKESFYIGTDGLGVFRLSEHSFIPVNSGLLNFPESNVNEYLKLKNNND